MNIYSLIIRHTDGEEARHGSEGCLWHAARDIRADLREQEPGTIGLIRHGPVVLASWVLESNGNLKPLQKEDIFSAMPPAARMAVMGIIDEPEEVTDLLNAVVRAVWTSGVESGRRR